MYAEIVIGHIRPVFGSLQHMCIFALALDAHPDYPCILLFNRDEDLSRPTSGLQLTADGLICCGDAAAPTQHVLPWEPALPAPPLRPLSRPPLTLTLALALTLALGSSPAVAVDGEAGGTWMGYNPTSGAVAALTNVRCSL